MSRVYNFSAGPAVLPEEVLKEAADEMLDYQGSGMSVMEMSHRSKVYDNIIKEAEQDSIDPDEKPQGRIYLNWSVGKESISGSKNLRRGS